MAEWETDAFYRIPSTFNSYKRAYNAIYSSNVSETEQNGQNFRYAYIPQ